MAITIATHDNVLHLRDLLHDLHKAPTARQIRCILNVTELQKHSNNFRNLYFLRVSRCSS